MTWTRAEPIFAASRFAQRTFRSLRHRNYRLYFIGQMVSLTGSWMQSTVLMWLAFRLTGESKWPAFLMVAQIGPTVLLGSWSGGLADRFPKRPVILITQICFLITTSILTLLLYLDALTIGIMLAVMLVHGVIQAVDLPARLAFVPDLVGREDLINAVALNSLLFNVARAVGPAIAGILLATVGATTCILINALSYFAVIGALLAMRGFPSRPPRPHREAAVSGFSVLRRQPTLLMVVLLAGGVAICGWPLIALLPAYAERVLRGGHVEYASLLSSVGIGALSAALFAAAFSKDHRRKRFMLGGLVAVAIALGAMALGGGVWLSRIACGLFGFGMILFFSTGQSTVQLQTDDAHRGKVMGVWAMMLSGGVPIGNLLTGPAADAFPIESVIAVQAAAIGLAAAALAVRMARK